EREIVVERAARWRVLLEVARAEDLPLTIGHAERRLVRALLHERDRALDAHLGVRRRNEDSPPKPHFDGGRERRRAHTLLGPRLTHPAERARPTGRRVGLRRTRVGEHHGSNRERDRPGGARHHATYTTRLNTPRQSSVGI